MDHLDMQRGEAFQQEVVLDLVLYVNPQAQIQLIYELVQSLILYLVNYSVIFD